MLSRNDFYQSRPAKGTAFSLTSFANWGELAPKSIDIGYCQWYNKDREMREAEGNRKMEQYATQKYGPEPVVEYWGTNFWVTLEDAMADARSGIEDGAGTVYVFHTRPDGDWVQVDADRDPIAILVQQK